ncbi:hypothetical protein ACLOJK_026626 [Asimina triloba]
MTTVFESLPIPRSSPLRTPAPSTPKSCSKLEARRRLWAGDRAPTLALAPGTAGQLALREAQQTADKGTTFLPPCAFPAFPSPVDVAYAFGDRDRPNAGSRQ